MDKKNKNKKIISLGITLFLVMLLVSGGSYAFWTWITATEERTNVTLTIEAPDMSATFTGYTQNISNLIPVTSCTDETYAIKKQVTLTYENLSANAGEILGTLSVENFVGPNGTPSVTALSHLHYAVTTSDDNCTSNPVDGMSGVFKSTTGSLFTGQKLVGPVPSGTTETSVTFYVWVWLDSDYSHQNVGSGVVSDPMQNISFDLVWSGEIKNDLVIAPSPNAPVLDNGLIPVKIANNGTVTTVSSTDPTWYNYDNKEWANAVLVKNEGTQLRSYYKNNPNITIPESDILAYYVWIPRYSYKIPNMTCLELDSPSIKKNPECYEPPYILTPEDKSSFVTWWYNHYKEEIEEVFGVEYTLDRATQDVETLLNTGSVYIEEEWYSIYFLDIISQYNVENGLNINYEATFLSNNIVTGPRTIDISFESKVATPLTGDAVNTYRTHPAFIFGNKNISGIWVGKFEATGDGATPTILPNLVPLCDQNVSTKFQTSLKFAGGTLSNGIVSFDGSNTYGLTINTDSHMMKNSEWGVVAYLSHSDYGINEKIRINNFGYWNTKTGCGAFEENGADTDTCQIAYGGASGYPQSTTGNISGIFDMSGGLSEYVMGVMADNNGNPISGSTLETNSGFNGLVNDGSSYTEGVAFPIEKYYDLYTSNNSLTACNGGICYGHALSETRGWYMVYSDSYISGEWIHRGGMYYDDINAGIFKTNGGYGNDSCSSTWRSVLIVD